MNKPLNLQCGLKSARPYLFVLLPGVIFIQGCASAPPDRRLPAFEESAAVTKPLVTLDKALPAPELYQVTAPALSREQIQQRFSFIEAMIRSGDYTKAQQAADSVNPLTLAEQETARLNLLYAQINLSTGDADLAIDYLKKIPPHILSKEQKIDFLQAQAFAFSLAGHSLESAKARIDLNYLLTDPEAQDQNQFAIFEALKSLSEEELINSEPPPTSSLAGWIALARLYKLQGQPEFNALLMQWRASFPDHPADPLLLFKNVKSNGNSLHYPGSIAVILPGSGRFADAGKAVKAGIMAAFDNLDSKAYKPNLHFYDSELATPAESYRQAIAGGAELVIGPLDKEDIQRLADSVTLTIPVLALNHIQNLEQDNLYQFALNPMDDVEQITGKARLDGHKKALLLIPENPQTRRIADYFEEYWHSGDSAILKTQTYRLNETDFSSPVEILLNRHETGSIDPGQAPGNADKPEADAIFISAYPSAARAIKQQLNVHGAESLAVYALSSIYAGQDNPAQDQVLDNITFCDIPWLFDTAYQGNLSLKSLSAIWRSYPDSYLPLIAMGIDAFNLSARLNNLASHPYTGATGKLSLLAEDNRIKRELICAKFTGGKPRVSGFIDQQDIPEPSDSSKTEGISD